ncbi:hypothetical protein AAWM_04127 [Aspergillus awamori]|uniref:Uncharacterized protein n=1 Tax=Aspergillus awamori TaxID=105351 RepID=A0A401KPR2_ASPAW|nr:hypothetical protein AAWM_04127 [Aspergillus awamori]
MFDVVNGRRIAIQNTQVSRVNCPSHAAPQEGTMCHMVPMIDIDVFPVAVENVRFRDRLLAPWSVVQVQILTLELGSLRGFWGSRRTERSEAETASKDNAEFWPGGGYGGYGGYSGNDDGLAAYQ